MHAVRMFLPKSPSLFLLLVVALSALVLTPDLPSLTVQELFPETSFDDCVRGEIEDCLVDLVKIVRLRA
jgi:hypothetical protein